VRILVLMGRNRLEDRVQCLDLGADDYLGKPFSYTELSARIRPSMRRSQSAGGRFRREHTIAGVEVEVCLPEAKPRSLAHPKALHKA
jgi:DNA-binding response OmpR family regulator